MNNYQIEEIHDVGDMGFAAYLLADQHASQHIEFKGIDKSNVEKIRYLFKFKNVDDCYFLGGEYEMEQLEIDATSFFNAINFLKNICDISPDYKSKGNSILNPVSHSKEVENYSFVQTSNQNIFKTDDPVFAAALISNNFQFIGIDKVSDEKVFYSFYHEPYYIRPDIYYTAKGIYENYKTRGFKVAPNRFFYTIKALEENDYEDLICNLEEEEINKKAC